MTIKIGDFDLVTNELIIRDMNEAELATLNQDISNEITKKEIENAEAEKKEIALQKLAALGLEINDLKALGLG